MPASCPKAAPGRSILADGLLEYLLGVGAVLMTRVRPRPHIEPGRVVQQLIDRGGLRVRQSILERIELPQGHRSGPNERDVRRSRPLLRCRVHLTDTGEEPGDRRNRGNHPAGERVQHGGFVIDRTRTVIPAVRLELLSDPHQLVHDAHPEPSGGVFRRPGPGMQRSCRLARCSTANLVVHARGDLQ